MKPRMLEELHQFKVSSQNLPKIRKTKILNLIYIIQQYGGYKLISCKTPVETMWLNRLAGLQHLRSG